MFYVGQTGDKLGDIPMEHEEITGVYSVRAGKFRRFHGLGLKQFLYVGDLLKNIRDVFYTLFGIGQSIHLLRKLRPEIIFVKGGFVGVPVGLAAAMLRIPYVTHDSDILPGLANRIIGKWAAAHAVAMPKDLYRYPQNKTFTVGVPVQPGFQNVTDQQQGSFKTQIGLKPEHQVVLVTGGGLGAERINQAVRKVIRKLLARYPNLAVVQIVGRANEARIKADYDELLSEKERGRVAVKGFISDLHIYSGAADVIITRAGATSVAEFAVQGKTTVIVPNPILTGGHQSKNAEVWAEAKAAVIVSEEQMQTNPELLLKAVTDLLDSPEQRQLYARRLQDFAHPNAAHDLAMLLLETADQHHVQKEKSTTN